MWFDDDLMRLLLQLVSRPSVPRLRSLKGTCLSSRVLLDGQKVAAQTQGVPCLPWKVRWTLACDRPSQQLQFSSPLTLSSRCPAPLVTEVSRSRVLGPAVGRPLCQCRSKGPLDPCTVARVKLTSAHLQIFTSRMRFIAMLYFLMLGCAYTEHDLGVRLPK